MKAWMLDRPGQPLALRDLPQPSPRAGAVLVQIDAVPLLSYTRRYLAGELPYAYPPAPFSPGTNGIGRIAAVGEGVHALRVGQRVAVNPYYVAHDTPRDPAQILIGLTGISADSAPLQAAFAHGTWREFAELPASTAIALDSLDDQASERLAALAKFTVPFGGLRRGRLVAGEVVAVSGASGYFGSAAVLAALAMGASRVIALGRRRAALAPLAAHGHGRVVPVELSGDVERDAAAIRDASGGGVEFAFDIVGQARDPNATLAALASLRRGGRLVLMGSMQTPLPLPYAQMLRNNWEVIGHFMYTPADYVALVSLVASGQLSLEAVDVGVFPFEQLEQAIDAAERMEGLACTVAKW